jgi:amino acid transporter
MQTSILGVVPWQKAQNSPFLVSTFVETISSPFAARVATMLVLWIAFASIFASLLGYSRVPYAAALDGSFFSIFSRVHPEKKFPHVSLLFLGAVAFVSSLLFRLSTVIAAILATRLLVQFIGQAIGLILLHRRWPPERFPFKMWLYPLPAVFTMCGWAALFWATGSARKWGLLLIGLGILAFLLRAREMRQWPFAVAEARPEPEGA